MHTVSMNKYDIDELLKILQKKFSGVKTKAGNIKSKTIQNCLMSAIAVFIFKSPSLLQFEIARGEASVSHNLRTLFGIEKVPCDTYMREVLDKVDPQDIRGGFKYLFRVLQTSKKLREFAYIDGHYLLSVDGTMHFSSGKIHCEHCCEKHHKNGTVTYHHSLVAGAFVHPDMKAVIPICPEAITKQDGDTKNDCEFNAGGRLLKDYRREHPHLKTIVIADGLYANAPYIKRLSELDLRFIIGAKSSDHKYLFEEVDQNSETQVVKHTDSHGTLYRYKYSNNVSLNKSNKDTKVNFLEYIEIKETGEQLYFSWVTDILITKDNLDLLVKAARARWKIENETFNTLKNQGYHFEHNFGHGKKHLSTIFAFLMLLVFLIDQIQLIGSTTFKKALVKAKSKVYLWFRMRSLLTHYFMGATSQSQSAKIESMIYGCGKRPS